MITMARNTVDPETRARLRRWLLYFRDTLEMSQVDLARAVGVGPGSLSDYLSGKKDVGLGTLIKMHRNLHRSANELLDHDPPARQVATGPPVDPQRASGVAGARGRDSGHGGG